jgi:hypothetical protein
MASWMIFAQNSWISLTALTITSTYTNLSAGRLGVCIDLTSEDMSVTAAESSVAVVLSSVALENTAETRTPRKRVTERALRCQ